MLYHSKSLLRVSPCCFSKQKKNDNQKLFQKIFTPFQRTQYQHIQYTSWTWTPCPFFWPTSCSTGPIQSSRTDPKLKTVGQIIRKTNNVTLPLMNWERKKSLEFVHTQMWSTKLLGPRSPCRCDVSGGRSNPYTYKLLKKWWFQVQ